MVLTFAQSFSQLPVAQGQTRSQRSAQLLLADNPPLLTGPLWNDRPAALNALFPFNPYSKPNNLIRGDKTSSDVAQVELGTVTLGIPVTGNSGPKTRTGRGSTDRLNGLYDSAVYEPL